jgi:hypothetical protein
VGESVYASEHAVRNGRSILRILFALHDGESGMENAPKVKCGLQWAHHLGCVGLCSLPLFPRVKVLIADGTSLEMVGNHTWKELGVG